MLFQQNLSNNLTSNIDDLYNIRVTFLCSQSMSGKLLLKEFYMKIKEYLEKINNQKVCAEKYIFLFVAWLISVIAGLALFMHDVSFENIIANSVFLLPLYGVLLVLIGNISVSLIVTLVLEGVVQYLNEYIFHIRYTYIQYNDFYNIGNAMRVSSNYEFTILWKALFKVLFLAAIGASFALIARYFCKKKELLFKAPVGNRIAGLCLIFVSFLLFSFLKANTFFDTEKIKFDINEYTEEKGLVYAWYCQYVNSELVAPEGYSEAAVDELLSTFADDKTDDFEKINIVVIMNESLADYSAISDLNLENDVLANYHSLNENCKKGLAIASIYGGYTCNSEFEFLTGESMGFLPVGTVPYIQYIRKKTDSICYDLKKLGYKTTAIHPYYSAEWNRKSVYPLLGFDKMIFGEDFADGKLNVDNNISDMKAEEGSFGEHEYVRGFISDKECYRTILEELNEHEGPDFIYNVTVQNHGGYEGNNTQNDLIEHQVVLKENGEREEIEKHEVNEYLYSVSKSDEAFGWFMNELKKLDEKTIVVMYGDHQPFLQEINSFITFDSDNEMLQKYTVPYIMWANYDVDLSRMPDMVSLNYLSALVKNNANIPMTAYDKFRLSLYEKYPVITAGYIMDSTGNTVSNKGKYDELIKNYEYVQYDRMRRIR